MSVVHLYFSFFLASIFTSFTPLCAFAATEVVEAALIEFRPISWTEDHQVMGSYVDLLKAIEEKVPVKFKIQTYPFLRAIDHVKNHPLSFTIAPLTSAAPPIGGPKIFLYDHQYFLITKKQKPVCSFSDIKGEIGRLRGGCSEILPSHGIHLFEVSSYEQGLKMLQKDRIDGFCGVEEGLGHWLKFLNLDDKQYSQFPLKARAAHMQFSAKFTPGLFHKIEKAVEEMIKDGTLEKIQHKFNESTDFLKSARCPPSPDTK